MADINLTLRREKGTHLTIDEVDANFTGLRTAINNEEQLRYTEHYTKEQSDARFINYTGDTINGDLLFGNKSGEYSGFSYGVRFDNGSDSAGIHFLTAGDGTTPDGKSQSNLTFLLSDNGNEGFAISNYNYQTLEWSDTFYVNANVFTYKGNKVWHEGIDGAGSTLDADLLDGQHASAFAPAVHIHDDRYFTEGEIVTNYYNKSTSDSRFAPFVHNHDTSYYTKSHSDSNYVLTTPDLQGSTIKTIGRINLASSSNWALGNYVNGQDVPDTGTGGPFRSQGDVGYIGWSEDPFGKRNLVWVSRGNDLASDADGGWVKAIKGINHLKSYMSVVYIRRTANYLTGVVSTNGSIYHGCGGRTDGSSQYSWPYNNTLSSSDELNNNPYWIATNVSVLPLNVWCVSIGFILSSDDSGSSLHSPVNHGGLYRVDTGEKLVSYSSFKHVAGSNTQLHRSFVYYSTDPNLEVHLCNPGFYEVNGNEPTLSELTGGTVVFTHGQNVRSWNSLNDGSGSGLDADLLDGLDSSAFAPASHTHTTFGNLTTGNLTTGNITAQNVSLVGVTESVHDLGGSASSITLSVTNGNIKSFVLSRNLTVTDGLSSGQHVVLRLTSASSYSITWPSGIKWVSSAGNIAPTLTQLDTLVFWKIHTTLFGVYVGSDV